MSGHARMEILNQIEKTREYLSYIEEHVLNVQKAWEVLIEKLRDMSIIRNDILSTHLSIEIENHDLSKMSEQEFVQYRKSFYPTDKERENDLGDACNQAWEHHKICNYHHWETWTTTHFLTPNEWKVHCVHMVIDWMAMSYKFGGTAQSYYEDNKDEIKLPEYAVKYIYKIFKRIT